MSEVPIRSKLLYLDTESCWLRVSGFLHL